MAAPMPMGAYFMMIVTSLNVTSAIPSVRPSIISFGLPVTWVRAMPNSVAQKTTCRTSLFAAASKKLWGTMWFMKPAKVVGAACGMAVFGSGGGRMTPTPGRLRLPAVSPMASAMKVMNQKYRSDFPASRPIRLRSSPWPAMPTTRVPKMIGTTMDLIIRRKIVESGLSSAANPGRSHPTRIPAPMPMKIQWVRVKRRR